MRRIKMYKRQRDFKLGQLHGKFLKEDDIREAHIRQTIFLSQKLKFITKKNITIDIRVFGYEVPLEANCKRGKCVDIMGYDSEYNLYLIELKEEKSSEKFIKISNQIKKYKDMVEAIRSNIEDDFQREFFFPIKFKKIIPIVLATREFYKIRKVKIKADQNDVKFTYFANSDIHKIKSVINIHLVEKMK